MVHKSLFSNLMAANPDMHCEAYIFLIKNKIEAVCCHRKKTSFSVLYKEYNLLRLFY